MRDLVHGRPVSNPYRSLRQIFGQKPCTHGGPVQFRGPSFEEGGEESQEHMEDTFAAGRGASREYESTVQVGELSSCVKSSKKFEYS